MARATEAVAGTKEHEEEDEGSDGLLTVDR